MTSRAQKQLIINLLAIKRTNLEYTLVELNAMRASGRKLEQVKRLITRCGREMQELER